MRQPDLEDILRRVKETGALIDSDPERRVYRLDLDGRPVLLKFYPAGKGFHVGAAMSEFTRLQWLQKASIRAPKAIATLMGFNLDSEKGDALLVECLEPAIPLADLLRNQERQIQKRVLIPRNLFQSLVDLLSSLAKAKLGHSELSLDRFIVHHDRIYLKDARGIHREGLTLDELLQLAADADPYLSRPLAQRAWNRLGSAGKMPRSNPRILSLWHDHARLSLGTNARFVALHHNPWRLHAFLQTPRPRHWSETSWIAFTPEDWLAAWPGLEQQIASKALKILHHSDSGDVFEADWLVGDKRLSVIIKCPRPKNFRRRISQWILGPRARRAWIKAWELVERDIPTAWPLLLAERKGQSLLIMEKVPGKTLAQIGPDDRILAETLFRCGRTLRMLESTGLYLYDSKAHNWIVRHDAIPVVIDLDSVRRIRQPGGFKRLLRSLRELHGEKLSRSLERQLALGYKPSASRHQQDQLLEKR